MRRNNCLAEPQVDMRLVPFSPRFTSAMNFLPPNLQKKVKSLIHSNLIVMHCLEHCPWVFKLLGHQTKEQFEILE